MFIHPCRLQFIKPASRTINIPTEQNSHPNRCIENNKKTDNSTHKYNTSSDSEDEQTNTKKEHLHECSIQISASSTSQISRTKITYRKKISPNTQIKCKINANSNWNTAITRYTKKVPDIIQTVGILNLKTAQKNLLPLTKYTVGII